MIVEYHNFLTEDECNFLIGLGESNQLDFGKTIGNKVGYRKAKVYWLDKNPIIEKISNKVSELTNTPIENQESFHFVKYNTMGEYKLHHDGTSRVKTALIYLNDGFRGGETEFPKIGKMIKPEVGKLIIWDNLLDNGDKDYDSYHTGLPVEVGTKYIAVIWIKK